MKTKKILLLACDPGGANTVASLMKTLKDLGYRATLFGKNAALNRYEVLGVLGENLEKFVFTQDFNSVLNFIRAQRPDIVVTGTSAEDFTEKYTWKSCESLNIPSIAILDQWVNYGIRFSRYKLSELESYNKNPEHDFLPSKVCVMDDFARQKMIKVGIDAQKIVVTGQPYFDWLTQNVAAVPQKTSSVLKTVLFLSEPISQNCENYLGYDEKTIFDQLIKVLQQISLKNSIKINLIIKTHPREKSDYFEHFIRANPDKNLSLNLITQANLYELFPKVDLVCGMYSMALLEAVILKKNVISIQIGLKRESPFILDVLGVLKSMKTSSDLYAQTQSILIDKKNVQCDFKFVQNSIKNVVMEIERELSDADYKSKKNREWNINKI